jgi:hypothetical protein
MRIFDIEQTFADLNYVHVNIISNALHSGGGC